MRNYAHSYISFFKSFYWSIVELQCCVSFRCTALFLYQVYSIILNISSSVLKVLLPLFGALVWFLLCLSFIFCISFSFFNLWVYSFLNQIWKIFCHYLGAILGRLYLLPWWFNWNSLLLLVKILNASQLSFEHWKLFNFCFASLSFMCCLEFGNR